PIVPSAVSQRASCSRSAAARTRVSAALACRAAYPAAVRVLRKDPTGDHLLLSGMTDRDSAGRYGCWSGMLPRILSGAPWPGAQGARPRRVPQRLVLLSSFPGWPGRVPRALPWAARQHGRLAMVWRLIPEVSAGGAGPAE